MSSEAQGFLFSPLIDPARPMTWVASSDENVHIRQSVLLLLTIRKGERPLTPDFGNLLQQFMFLPQTAALRKQIELHLQEVIRTQESRVRDVQVTATPDPKHPTQLEIAVLYRLASQGQFASVVVHFDLHRGLYGL